MNVPEMTRKRVLTTDFSRRVIDELFRLATMDWTRIFAVLRGTTYLQPTVKSDLPTTNGLATAYRSLGVVVPRAILAARG